MSQPNLPAGRYVLLRHTGASRGDHWDFMLEHDGVLWTWAIDRLPQPCSSVPAERLPDHRLAYLEYEGDISDNRGQVKRQDAGSYRILLQLQAPDEFQVAIEGETLRGTFSLLRRQLHWHRESVL